MKRIPLTQGKFAIVDDEDYEELAKHNWYCHLGYAKRKGPVVKGKPRQTLYMHRIINKTPDGMHTDHINFNRLDNRKSNLRSCTHAQNVQHRTVKSNNNSGIRGVYLKGDGRIESSIRSQGKYINLGTFKTIEEAAVAHSAAAKMVYGEFASA